MTERDDHDAIMSMLAEGYSTGKAARVLGLDEADIRAALKVTIDNFRNGEALRQTWALEDWRLGQMLAKLFKDAMSATGADSWHACVAYTRVSSRRAELCGANSPQAYSVTLMQAAAPPELTSTQSLRLAIDHVIGLDTTPEDILAEWEDPELEKKHNEVRAAVQLRNKRKSELAPSSMSGSELSTELPLDGN